jgi:5'-3' exonuclease
MKKLNRYQQLYNELQQEKQFSPSHYNDHILVVDGLNSFIRAFGATPAYNEDGDHVGGITGFLYSVGKVVRDFRPTRCIIVFDGRGGSSRRKKLYTEYKGNRANKTKLRRFDHHESTIESEQESMKHQFSRLVSYLDYLPVTYMAIDGIEADDTIAYIASQFTDSKLTIMSTDRDFYQLISDRINVWSPTKKKMYDLNQVIEEFGVHPNNMVAYRAFIGDGSDNIPGISGIGPKTLLKLFPELAAADPVTIEFIMTRCRQYPTNKQYQKIAAGEDVLQRNFQLMDITLLDFSAQLASHIRSMITAPIPQLNRSEFQRLFFEDKMWATMKNMPEWLTNTWLSLSAFSMQTNK